MATKKTAPKATKEDVATYLDLEQQRKRLGREAKALAKQQQPLVKKFIADARANGGKTRSVKRGGHVLALTKCRGQVGWKNAYIEVQGAEAAEELIAACPMQDKLTVEKVA